MPDKTIPVKFSEIDRPAYFWARMSRTAVSMRTVSSNDIGAMMELKDRLEEDADTRYATLSGVTKYQSGGDIYILHICTATRAEGWSVEEIYKEWKADHYGLPILREQGDADCHENP